jgi:hypothetical protein
MNWKGVAGKIGKFAPLLGTVLGGPVGGGVGTLVAAALGVDDSPDAVDAALNADPQAAAKLRELEERNRHDLEAAHIRAAETSVREVNETIRIEATSGDAYVRRARPTLIYLIGAIVLIQVLGSFILLAIDSSEVTVAGLRAILAETMPPLAILCGAVGVYVRSRSTYDKSYAAGREPPPGLLQTLLGKGKT